MEYLSVILFSASICGLIFVLGIIRGKNIIKSKYNIIEDEEDETDINNPTKCEAF